MDKSWDEMGSIDVPDTIRYILNYTGEKTLSFICKSFGCNLVFISMIVQPELNESVDVLLALAPAAGLRNVQNPTLNFIHRHWNAIEVICI